MHSVGDVWLWGVFFTLFLIIFGVDFLFVGGRKAHVIQLREAFLWVTIWAICAILFGILIWYHLLPQGAEIAQQKTLEFYTGYIIEQSLSVDNMFVILLIFQSFAVPARWQRRVLLWGVLGAVVMRFIFIFAGIGLVTTFHWILYLFGIFLVWSGVKFFFTPEKIDDPAKNRFVQWLSRHMRVTTQFEGERFFVKQNHFWYATPLFLALILIEFSDLIFALDSIPAIFAVTLDPFIVVSSNIFAIMGLRALFCVVAHSADRFVGLKYGVALVLILTGSKMLVQHWITLPILPMLLLIVVLLVGASLIGWFLQKRS
ncbi:MAG: TerC/Alx family metal homeostasis membrane protein [Gammaproteobacteria bacterium]|nr:TerC/Alx family metal homeostasis membrane protein [Gammaproteobacteria bacterium]